MAGRILLQCIMPRMYVTHTRTGRTTRVQRNPEAARQSSDLTAGIIRQHLRI
ncbi:MAG: hypothetical protein IKO33_02225 [Bacteroidaceae bacterium]|nr:hypothetical protein [Bacteroidaceae bacterium]